MLSRRVFIALQPPKTASYEPSCLPLRIFLPFSSQFVRDCARRLQNVDAKEDGLYILEQEMPEPSCPLDSSPP